MRNRRAFAFAGKLTLILDLGTFLLESDTRTASQLPTEEAALYECVRLEGRNISSYLVDGDFSFSDLEQRLESNEKGHSNLNLAQVGHFKVDLGLCQLSWLVLVQDRPLSQLKSLLLIGVGHMPRLSLRPNPDFLS